MLVDITGGLLVDIVQDVFTAKNYRYDTYTYLCCEDIDMYITTENQDDLILE